MKKLLMITALSLPLSATAAEFGSFITGGIGADERVMFAEKKADYNLEVKTALNSGHFLGDVSVKILKDEAIVLEGNTDGPLFFAKLHPGVYTVQATHGEQMQSKSISIGDSMRMREVMFRFDGNEAIVEGDPSQVPEGGFIPEEAKEVQPNTTPHYYKDPNVGDGVYFKKDRNR